MADVDVVAYTRGPGLAGALLVGAGVACALAAALDIDEAQAKAIYDDIGNKRRTTRYMHLPPVLVADVPEPHAQA